MWTLWSPNYRFDDATYEKTAASFDNADFVDVVIQSYRHRYGNAPGDPAVAEVEARLAAQPVITARAIILHGAADGVTGVPDATREAKRFSRLTDRRVIPGAGHFLPREAPGEVVRAVRDLG